MLSGRRMPAARCRGPPGALAVGGQGAPTVGPLAGRGAKNNPGMEFTFAGTVIEWRGPPAYYFVRILEGESGDIKLAARGIQYWGQVPVAVRINEVEFRTALFPKTGAT